MRVPGAFRESKGSARFARRWISQQIQVDVASSLHGYFALTTSSAMLESGFQSGQVRFMIQS